VPGPYSFTGHVTTGFPDYRDTATGRMLIAEPGGSYGIEAINGAGVPPGTQWVTAPEGQGRGADGRWAAPPDPPPVPPVPSVPAVNEGSETA
jgi:hypothetical protein